MPNASDQPELTLYQTDDGITRIHVRLVDGSVWLSQRQLADRHVGRIALASCLEEPTGPRGPGPRAISSSRPLGAPPAGVPPAGVRTG